MQIIFKKTGKILSSYFLHQNRCHFYKNYTFFRVFFTKNKKVC